MDNIENYLDQIGPGLALLTVIAIAEASRRLEHFPAIGTPIDEETRSLPVGRQPYRLIYRIAESRNLQILRIRHVREDWRAS